MFHDFCSQVFPAGFLRAQASSQVDPVVRTKMSATVYKELNCIKHSGFLINPNFFPLHHFTFILNLIIATPVIFGCNSEVLDFV